MLKTCTRCGRSDHNTRTCSNHPVPRITRGRGGQPGNTNALRHGFYAAHFKDHDLQSLSLIHDHIDLNSEINMLRIAVDRVLDSFHSELDFNDFIALFNIIVRASGRIGQLIKVQKLIESDSNGPSKELLAILEQVAEEYDLD